MKSKLSEVKNLSLYFFYVAFVLYFLFVWASRINFDASLPMSAIKSVLRLAIVILLFGRYLFVNLNWKGYVLTAALAIGGLLTWRISGEGWLFWLVLFVITAQGVDYHRLALISAIQSFVLLIVVPSFCLVGIIGDRKIYHDTFTRSSLGFMHPNNFGLLILVFSVSLTVLFLKSKVWLPASLTMILAVANYFISHSRSSVISLVLLVALSVIFAFVTNHRAQQIISYALLGIVGFCITLSYIAMVFYTPSSQLWRNLDVLLSGRLRLAHEYFVMHPLTLLGRSYVADAPIARDFDGKYVEFLVDNSYAHLLLRYGILATIILLGAYIAVLVKLVKTSRWDEVLLVLGLFAVYGLMETSGIRIEANFMLVALGTELLFTRPNLVERDSNLLLLKKVAE